MCILEGINIRQNHKTKKDVRRIIKLQLFLCLNDDVGILMMDKPCLKILFTNVTGRLQSTSVK